MEISVKKISTGIVDALENPKRFWAGQKQGGLNQKELLAGIFFPVLLFISAAVFIGEFFRSSSFYVVFALLKSLRDILLFTLQYFISLFLTNELIKTFGGVKNLAIVQKLVIFSLLPYLLVSFVSGLFPFLYVLDILGFYGFYIFWIGVKELLVFPDAKKQGNFILIAIFVNFFAWSFLSIFLTKLLIAYL